MSMPESSLFLQLITGDLNAMPDNRLAELAAYTARLRNGEVFGDHEVYRDLIDEHPNLVWQLTSLGETKYVNRRWREYFCRAEGMTPAEWKAVVHPDDYANFLGRWQVENDAGLLDPLDVRLRRHDGVYRWFSKRARAVRDRQGRFDYWIFTATDIDESKQFQVNLRLQEERLRFALKAGQIGIWDLTPETGELEWDEGCRAAFGFYSNDPVDYECFVRALHPDDVSRVRALVDVALDPTGDGLFEADYRVVGLSDGVSRHIHAEGRAVFAGQGTDRKAVRFSGVVKDISPRIRSEEALLQANRDLQQFAYAAAHDLQEPLRNISLSLGLLKLAHAVNMDEPGKQLVDTSIEGAKRIHGMVTDLLAFTRVTTQSLPVPEEPVDANLVLSRVEENLQLAINESGARIEAASLPRVAVCETHLVQLLQNIIGNSIKYRNRDQQPIISIKAERLLGWWQFSISDNGIGFDDVHAHRIFGVFKRLHHRHQYPGSGIGLAICSRIVNSYGGRIWATGKVNEGATFSFTLPAHSQG